MTLYVNSDVHVRVWPTIANAAGTTLRLAPGETAELDPEAVGDDPYLRPAHARPRAKGAASEPEPPAPAVPAVPAPAPATSEEK